MIGIVLFWVYYIYISPKIFSPTEVIVPQLVGKTEEEAVDILEKSSISYDIHYLDGEKHCVSSVVPASGTKVYEDYTIDLYVQKPLPSYYTSFVGLLYDSNIALIDSYCLKHHITYTLEYERSSIYSQGQIIRQSKSTDELIVEADNLVLTLAVENDYITIPNFVGKNIADVIVTLDEFQLSYTLIYCFAPIEYDTIISQGVNPGTIVKKGNSYSFEIYISKGMPDEMSSLKITDFIAVLSDLNLEYEIVYVSSNEKENRVIKIENKDKYFIYITGE